MDIEDFYESDERRRQSGEVELGIEWRDGSGVRYELNWVRDTGEVYVMREPAPHVTADPFGGLHTDARFSAPTDGMTVAVVARIGTHEDLDRVFDGWEDAMGGTDGIAWLVERIRSAGVAVPAAETPD